MITASSSDKKLYESYEEFVQEVHATRKDVEIWDKVATKVDSFIGYSNPGFYASYEAIMNQYDFLIGCIEGERTMACDRTYPRSQTSRSFIHRLH